jgi:hypothetical protein
MFTVQSFWVTLYMRRRDVAPSFWQRLQKTILNFAPRGKLWPPGTCPRGVNFVPSGWSYPRGDLLGGIILCSLLLSSKRQSVFTPGGWTKGWTIPLEDKVHPWGPSSPLGANHSVKNWPQRSVFHSLTRVKSGNFDGTYVGMYTQHENQETRGQWHNFTRLDLWRTHGLDCRRQGEQKQVWVCSLMGCARAGWPDQMS